MQSLHIASNVQALNVDQKIAKAEANKFLRGLLVVAVVSLCSYGTYDAILAMLKVIQRTRPSTGYNAFFDYPWWSFAHFLPGIVFMMLGPLQFSEGFRNRYRKLHRWSGRLVIIAGLALAFSGIVFPFTMPERPIGEKVFFVTVFSTFLFFLVKAYSLARRRQFVLHRVWMIRMFGAGLSAITQRAIFPVFVVTVGIHRTSQFWELFITALWLSAAVNLSVMEWWISHTRSRTHG
jgi:hypothetical protein